MRRFLKYQFALCGTHESEITEDFRTKVEQTLFANSMYGVNGIGISADDEIAVYGEIISKTKQECKATYTLLKASAKGLMPNCKKTNDLMVATGDKLW